jgi:hypothetical protein
MRGLLFLTAALLPFVGEARAEEKEKEPTVVIERTQRGRNLAVTAATIAR